MKVRIGFVSNSSSSSFVLIVGNEALDNYVKNLDDFKKLVVDCMNFSKGKINGFDIKYISEISGECAGGCDAFFNKITKNKQKLIKALKKTKDYNEGDEEIFEDIAVDVKDEIAEELKKLGGFYVTENF